MTMMKKGNVTILASILAIALVAAGVGAGTMAWFSTEKVSAGNTVFKSGIMAMTSVGAGPFTTPAGWKPGDSFKVTFELDNTGDIDILYLATFFTIDPYYGWGITFAENIQVTAWWEYIPGTGWQDNFADAQKIYTLVGDGQQPLTLLEVVQAYTPDEIAWHSAHNHKEAPFLVLDQFGNYVKADSDYLTGGGYDMTPGPAIKAGLDNYKMEITFKFMESAGNDLQNRELKLYTQFFGMQAEIQRP
jgi:hypothetical protein